MAVQHAKNLYLIPRGRVYLDPLDASENYSGEIYLGNCPGLTLSIESEKAEHYSSENAKSEKDATWTVRIKRGGTLNCDNFSAANAALWLAGSHSRKQQQATPVSGERRTVQPGRYYQLGATAANPLGVRGVSAITVHAAAGSASQQTVSNEKHTGINQGQQLTLAHAPVSIQSVKVGAAQGSATPVNAAGNYTMTASGLQVDASAPDIPNGSTLWVSYTYTQSAPGAAYQAGVDYLVDGETGRVQILEGGAISAPTEVLFGYTPMAGHYDSVRSGAGSEVTGALRIVSDNASGGNRDWYMPRVTLTANGDLPLISEGSSTDVVQMQFSLDVLTPPNADAIYCDGRPMP